MAYITTNTRVTRNSITDFTIGVNELFPAVHYVDDVDSSKQFLLYCPEMTIKFGCKVEIIINVIRWIPELNQWVNVPYTQAFSIGRMLIDNATYVDGQTGLPLIPQPTDNLETYIGEYAFWEATMGSYIIPAVQDGATRRFNAFI